MSDELLFTFADESVTPLDAITEPPWVVLSVEDDPGYQQSLKVGLSSLTVKERPVLFLTASSASQASSIIAERNDIAVILLDVVMEQDDAGLFLVNTIRNVLGNNEVRIVLLTGQPGMAPRMDTMRDFDVDEYWNKVDLTEDKLRTIVSSNIRTWHSMHELSTARRGLQMIVDASKAIISRHDVHEFTKAVLDEVARLIGVPRSGGIACAYNTQPDNWHDCPIIAVNGEFANKQPQTLQQLVSQEGEELRPLMETAAASGQHQFKGMWSVLYFSTHQVDQRHYLIIVKSPERLLSSHISLLMVLSENVSNGFTNLALMNKLSAMAFYDQELLIANRNWLQRELVTASQQERANTAIVVIKVEDYYPCEIMLGADFAIDMMRSLLNTLRERFARYQTVARIEDDTFAFLFDRQQLPADQVLTDVTDLSLNISSLSHKASCAIAVLDLQHVANQEPEKALRLAEATLNEGQQQHTPVAHYSPVLKETLESHYLLLKELQDAISEPQELALHYQPKYDLHTGRIVGAEALLRWHHPSKGLIMPASFIPLAETSGLVNKLDLLVMQQVFKDMRQLQRHDFALPVSFNVSCSSFDNSDFLQAFDQQLDNTSVPHQLLEVEVTESQAVGDYLGVKDVLNHIANQGVRVSIDDFGTGYSSLAHVAKLPAHVLKVDRSFISQLTGEDPDGGLAMLKMIKALGDQFGADLVAEGVETDEQRQILADNGFSLAQGFLFSRAIPLAALLEQLGRQHKSS